MYTSRKETLQTPSVWLGLSLTDVKRQISHKWCWWCCYILVLLMLYLCFLDTGIWLLTNSFTCYRATIVTNKRLFWTGVTSHAVRSAYSDVSQDHKYKHGTVYSGCSYRQKFRATPSPSGQKGSSGQLTSNIFLLVLATCTLYLLKRSATW